MTIYAKVEENGRVDSLNGDIGDPNALMGPHPPPPPGEGWMLITTLPGPRPHKDFEWRAEGGVMSWFDPRTLEQVRAEKIEALAATCGERIVAGFTSAALGSAYAYPAKITDQTNLAGSILASLLPGNALNWATPFWCADAAGNWAFRDHTAAQIQQVGRDGKAAILSAMETNESLRAQVTAATSIDAVSAIGWAE